MTPTIEDFDGVVWSLDSIGPKVADAAIIHRIDVEVLPAGRPALEQTPFKSGHTQRG